MPMASAATAFALNTNGRKTPRSITGDGWVAQRCTNHASSTADVPSAASVPGSLQPQALDCTTPYASAATPTMTSTTPNGSGSGPASGSTDSSSTDRPSTAHP